jgi:hypothetical protein
MHCLFLTRIAVLEFVCLVLFIYSLLQQPTVEAAMIRRDSSLLGDDEKTGEEHFSVGTPLLLTSRPKVASVNQLSLAELMTKSWPCCCVLWITLVPSFLVASWFTKVHTTWMALASCLFYVRIACDFLGRLATILLPPRSISCLMQTSLLRLILVALFFGNAHQISPLSNELSILLVAILSFLSGYLVTATFQLAPLVFGEEEEQIRQGNAAPQTNVLTVAFATSAVSGLLSTFFLMALGV